MNRRISTAIVGVGFMGGLHAEVLRDHPLAKLDWVVDTSEARARQVAEQCGANWATNLDDILVSSDVRAVVVALPDLLHVEVTSALLMAGKAVLLEKPMAHSLAAAQSIRDAASVSGSPLMVGHLVRFDPRYRRAAELVRSGSIGKVIHATASRFCRPPAAPRPGNSVCFLVGVHDVDALQWVTGQRITRVLAMARRNCLPGHEFDMDDVVYSLCEFEDGALGALSFGWTLPSSHPWELEAGLTVTGSEGQVRIDAVDDSLLTVSSGAAAAFEDSYYWPLAGGRRGGNLARELDHFLTSVVQQRDFEFSVNDACRAVAVNDALLASIDSGLWVEVEPV